MFNFDELQPHLVGQRHPGLQQMSLLPTFIFGQVAAHAPCNSGLRKQAAQGTVWLHMIRACQHPCQQPSKAMLLRQMEGDSGQNPADLG